MTEFFNKVADVGRTIMRGLDFTKGPSQQKPWKGINDAWIGINALQLAFNVHAIGAPALVSMSTAMVGLGLGIAYAYGRN